MPHSPATEWVVYRMRAVLRQVGHNAICTQSEWEAMELTQAGHTLIRAHIGNEGEAERLARDLQTPPEQPKPPRKPVARQTTPPPVLTGVNPPQ
jgi:hypothetical protein